MNQNVRIASQLQAGEVVKTRLSGNSMTPIIQSRQLVTIEPCTIDDVQTGDVVFCKVKGKYFLHLITAKRDGQVQISNNHGHVNGWTTKIFGKLVKVEE